MSPDPFLRPDLEFVSQPAGNHSRAYPEAALGGFCGIKIRPDCLRIDSGGVVRVSLSATAAEWFETLSGLGEVLHLTRNPVAVLGQLGEFPALKNWSNPLMPRDASGLFAPNLAEFASLWAVRELSPLGVLHGLEARDVSGMVFERVLLSGRARHELFEQFVADHQSPSEEAGHWFSANHAWSARCRASLAGRIPWLRSRSKNGSADVRQLSPEFLPRVLDAAARADFSIRTTHYHRALIRSVIWTPHDRKETESSKNPREFFSGANMGLHLNLPALGSVWLWTGKCACCAEQHWTVEITDAHDQLGLSLMSGPNAGETEWRDLLGSCL